MIHVTIDSNEAMRPRAELIRKAVASDPHFEEIPPVEPMPFDLEFWSEGDITKALHVELKDFTGQATSDYVNSIINGHGWEQCQAAREIGEPFIIAVLGDDHDIQAAIRAAAGEGRKGGNGKRGKPACFDVDKFAQYSALVDGFEANCEGCQIRVIKLGYNQYPRLLLRARKVLEGGDLSGFCPKPAEKERMEVGLSILAGRGVGPKMAANILKRYNLCLIRRDGYCGDLEDIPGIGPKRAETIKRNIEVMD